jgi:hypothetical protein
MVSLVGPVVDCPRDRKRQGRGRFPTIAPGPVGRRSQAVLSGARAKRSGKALTRRVRLRHRELEKPAILRGLGFVCVPAPLGYVRRAGRLRRDRPAADARLGILPHLRQVGHSNLRVRCAGDLGVNRRSAAGLAYALRRKHIADRASRRSRWR